MRVEAAADEMRIGGLSRQYACLPNGEKAEVITLWEQAEDFNTLHIYTPTR